MTPTCIGCVVTTSVLREVLEAWCERDGLSLDSTADPGTPARNYELMIRLGIGRIVGVS